MRSYPKFIQVMGIYIMRGEIGIYIVKVIEEDKPLPEHTKLDYYECYAKIVLEEMFPERFSDLIIIDKPDLQNEQLDIGVEVTSSVNAKQKEVEALYVKWHAQGDEGKKIIERQINVEPS